MAFDEDFHFLFGVASLPKQIGMGVQAMVVNRLWNGVDSVNQTIMTNVSRVLVRLPIEFVNPIIIVAFTESVVLFMRQVSINADGRVSRTSVRSEINDFCFGFLHEMYGLFLLRHPRF